jgi:hypothetical protein
MPNPLEHNDTIPLKKEKVATIISNLYQNKVIYRERCIGVVTLDNIQLESDFFLAIAKPCLLLPTTLREDEVFLRKEKWDFGTNWSVLKINDDNSISGYGSWKIYTNPEFVKNIETLILNNQFEEAHQILNV